MNEENKYELIKKLIETKGNKQRAAVKIGCTMRTINRMIKGYNTKGKEFFLHGNRGNKPVNAISDKVRQLIIDLYRNKYYDANLTHFHDLLKDHENTKASTSTIRSILIQEFILSPKAKHSTKKRIKEHLKSLKSMAKTKKEIDILDCAIVAAEDAHPRRPRCAYIGEMLQMDASIHHWFGQDKTQLHIAVDDATGAIMGAYFDEQETLKGYYNVLNQVLTDYGIPYMFFTDRRTVFEYKNKKSTSVEEDTFTQFGYACKQLGIEIQTSSVAQAKGRVERMFQTLQSRLPVELRLAGVNTLEQANEFLNHYVKKFNAQFALPINNIKSVFELQPDFEKINLTLAILAGRKIDNGSCIRFKKNYYLPLDANGYPVHYHKGSSATVIEAFDGQMFLCVGEKICSLYLLPSHELSSKRFDFVSAPVEPKKRYIPPMNHPWRQSQFNSYVNGQKHRENIPA